MGSGGSRDVRRFPQETLCDHDGSINCVAASDDQSLLVTGSDDRTVRVWDIVSPDAECIGILRGHTSYITCVSVVDIYVLSGSADNTIRKWDITSCDCVYTYNGHVSRISRVLCTGEYVLSTSHDHTAKAWYFHEEDLPCNDEDSSCICTFEGHTGGIVCQVVIPGQEATDVLGAGDLLITGSLDYTARIWSFTSHTCLKQKLEGHSGCVSSMATDLEGKVVYTASVDKTLRSWDIDTGTCLRVFVGHKSHVVCLLVLKTLLYSGDGSGGVRGWDVSMTDAITTTSQKPLTHSPLTSYTGNTNTVNRIKFHQGLLYTACSDNMIRAFDATTKELRCVYVGHKNSVNCLIMCGSRLYTGSTDTTLMVWHLAKRKSNVLPSTSQRVDSTAALCLRPGKYQKPAPQTVTSSYKILWTVQVIIFVNKKRRTLRQSPILCQKFARYTTSRVAARYTTSRVAARYTTSRVAARYTTSRGAARYTTSRVAARYTTSRVAARYTTSRVAARYTTSRGAARYTTSRGAARYTTSRVAARYTTSRGAARYTTSRGAARYTTSRVAARYTTSRGAARYTTSRGAARYTTSRGAARYTTSRVAARYTTSLSPMKTTTYCENHHYCGGGRLLEPELFLVSENVTQEGIAAELIMNMCKTAFEIMSEENRNYNQDNEKEITDYI
ncbi:uncharacterized protein [Panulirus ornatus]|uniref:uncharacterized protein n=1 Tax=Panulirus ornatus TaxID=150431 RepID=UPI003A87E735